MSRVTLIKPKRLADERGWFSETYSRRNAAQLGIGGEFVQDNHSLSRPAGTVRGLHFQTPPHAQAKLVRCVRGRIMDYAVDIRQGSPTYGRHVAAELTAENGWQLYVPIGFAHGFVTLEPDCEITYKVSDYYAPAHDAGLRWNDPAIRIAWPLPPSGAVLSPKDVRLPLLAEFDSPFPYDGEPLAPHLD
jgi:dTDP-4-dehydrorhamnose 3,5-epimerase